MLTHLGAGVIQHYNFDLSNVKFTRPVHPVRLAATTAFEQGTIFFTCSRGQNMIGLGKRG